MTLIPKDIAHVPREKVGIVSAGAEDARERYRAETRQDREAQIDAFLTHPFVAVGYDIVSDSYTLWRQVDDAVEVIESRRFTGFGPSGLHKPYEGITQEQTP